MRRAVLGLVAVAIGACGGRDGRPGDADAGPARDDGGPAIDGSMHDATAPACSLTLEWIDAPALPAPRESLALVANDATVFAMGGWSGGGAESDIFVADLDPIGSPITWHMGGRALPAPREHHRAVWLEGARSIVSAGGDDGVAAVDGTDILAVGPGDTTAYDVTAAMDGDALPEARSSLALVVAHDGAEAHLYAIGGSVIGGPPRSEVWMRGAAESAWSASRPLPVPLSFVSAIGVDGGIFVIGGRAGAGAIAETWHAAVLAGGDLGPWEPTTPLPAPSYAHEVVASAGQLWVMGGLDASDTASARVLRIGIEGDHLGSTWTESTPMPAARFGHVAASLPARATWLVAGGYPPGPPAAPTSSVWLADPCR